jgi:hypothetical protein
LKVWSLLRSSSAWKLKGRRFGKGWVSAPDSHQSGTTVTFVGRDIAHNVAVGAARHRMVGIKEVLAVKAQGANQQQQQEAQRVREFGDLLTERLAMTLYWPIWSSSIFSRLTRIEFSQVLLAMV